MAKTIGAGSRRDIQFLRALAVVSVVLFHFWPTKLVSGFLGVDVFFVISGFLITSLILREVFTTSRFSITAFWVRRIRRIFPAAITVIAVTVIAVFSTGLADPSMAIGRHAFASAFSVENLLLGLDSVDYVHRTDTTSPLQHYWSLSVEEQFYFVWPVVVLLGLWLSKRVSSAITRILAIALAAFGTGSFVYAVLVAQGNPTSYFDPLARAWELALGAGVALWVSAGRTEPGKHLVVNRIAWVVLAASFVVPGLESLTPGVGILPAALATAVVLATGPFAPNPRFRIAEPLLVASEWAGDRSYSIYLWHWPIILLLPMFLGHELGTVSKLGALALTLVLSEISYRFVENPVRRSKRAWTRSPVAMGGIALVASAAVVAGSFTLIPSFGKQETDTDLLAVMMSEPLSPESAGYNPEFPFTTPYCDGGGGSVFDCPVSNTVEYDHFSYPISPPRSETCKYEVETFIEDCVMGDVTSDRQIALVGDSHARAMWASLDTIGKRGGYAIHEFLTPRCAYRLYHFDWCTKHNRDIEPILNSGRFDLVILAQSSQQNTSDDASVPNPFVELFSELHDNGIPTVVMKDNPKRGPQLTECVKLQSDPGTCSRPFSPRIDWATETALAVGLPVVDFDNVYCPDGTCAAVRGGMLVWRDNGHISPFFHKSASPLLWSKLMELGLIEPR